MQNFSAPTSEREVAEVLHSILPPPVAFSCEVSTVKNIVMFLEMEDLRKSNLVTQSFKYSKESAANMVSAIRQWLYFTTFFSLKSLPATPDSLICFCEFLARSSSFQHIKHCIHAVQFLHESLDIDFPWRSFQLDMTLQGLKRRLARVAFQVLPITPVILRAMYRHLDMQKTHDLALWCAFLVSFYGLLRKKSVVPKAGPVDPKQVLVRRNLTIHMETRTVYIYLGFSKTNQFGARDLVIPILANSDPALDPFKSWCLIGVKNGFKIKTTNDYVPKT